MNLKPKVTECDCYRSKVSQTWHLAAKLIQIDKISTHQYELMTKYPKNPQIQQINTNVTTVTLYVFHHTPRWVMSHEWEWNLMMKGHAPIRSHYLILFSFIPHTFTWKFCFHKRSKKISIISHEIHFDDNWRHMMDVQIDKKNSFINLL